MDDGGTLRVDGCHRRPNRRQTQMERARAADHVSVTRATREDAPCVHGITHAAYAEYRGVLDPPSGVDRECVVDVERALDEGGAMLVWIDDTVVGAVVMAPEGRPLPGLGYQICSAHPYPEGTETWALLTKSVDGVPDYRPG